MIILAIETSCDETGVAILEGKKEGKAYSFTTLGQALLSQAALHAQYGGVYPNLAKREHEKNLPLMLEKAINEALGSRPMPEDLFEASIARELKIDAIAVTHGPGLEPALWTGITFAQKLAEAWSVPLIPINHMEGHFISSLVQNGTLSEVEMPILGLLISGGHTEFALMSEWLHYTVIGKTLDDAVGEAFDKVARMLGLPYPGGPEISKLAEMARPAQKSIPKKSSGLLARPQLEDGQGEARLFSPQISVSSEPSFHAKEAASKTSVVLPRPMLHSDNLDFSFSGLKTAVLYALRDRGGVQALSDDERAQFACEFEDAVTDVLVAKTKRALAQTGAKSFVIGGGVAANKHIRRSLAEAITAEHPEVRFYTPEVSITGDNAVMIAQAALARSLSGLTEVPEPSTIRASGHLSL